MTYPQLTDELTDDPIPSPRPSLTADLFFSGTDNGTTVPHPLTDPDTGAPIPTHRPPVEGPGSDSGSEWPDLDQSDAPADPTSSPGSPTGNPLSRAAARQTARAAVLTAGGVAHRLLAQTEGQRQVELYLADEEDAKSIGDPLGNIAHRHSGAIGAAANPDVADGLQAMLGMFGYLSKQILATAQAKRIDAGGLPAPVEESY